MSSTKEKGSDVAYPIATELTVQMLLQLVGNTLFGIGQSHLKSMAEPSALIQLTLSGKHHHNCRNFGDSALSPCTDTTLHYWESM